MCRSLSAHLADTAAVRANIASATHASCGSPARLFDLTSDLLKHLFGLEELEDHDLSLVLIEVNLDLRQFASVFMLSGILLGDLPGA